MRYLLAAALALCTAAHAAPPALPNEAVSTLPGGVRRVELPPGPHNEFRRPKPKDPALWNPSMRAIAYVIDTNDGLQECMQPWIEKNCRPYKPGAERRERAWVIKRAGQWLKCPLRDSAAGCVDYYALTQTEVQD
jgi:hypothetical protein